MSMIKINNNDIIISSYYAEIAFKEEQKYGS